MPRIAFIGAGSTVFTRNLVGDDVRFAVRPHATSPPFPELEGVLAHGDALEHPLFPRLR